MNQNEATKIRVPRPVVVSKCATPSCQEQTPFLYCDTCRRKQRQAQPEEQLP